MIPGTWRSSSTQGTPPGRKIGQLEITKLRHQGLPPHRPDSRSGADAGAARAGDGVGGAAQELTCAWTGARCSPSAAAAACPGGGTASRAAVAIRPVGR
jgi:hypothetical protein